MYLPLASAQEGPEALQMGEGGGLLSSLTLNSRHGPVEITAQKLEFDYRKLELTYEGGVTVRQGDMTLRADRLRVVLNEDGAERVQEIMAKGNVLIQQGERIAAGERAEFDRKANTVVLSDGAMLREGANVVKGERVIVYLDEERSVVEGGDLPVRAHLFPPGESETATPHSRSAAIFSVAVPLPPEMIAPAWPIRLPFGAV